MKKVFDIGMGIVLTMLCLAALMLASNLVNQGLTTMAVLLLVIVSGLAIILFKLLTDKNV